MTANSNIYSFLFTSISNAPLVLFRIVFGFLLMAESFGAILTGWVHSNLVAPQFSFTFIGFEWLNILIGPQMYGYFVLMGICGAMVMMGYRYRLAMVGFTVLWLGAYLIQKTSYNNHYYLLNWINLLMCFLPANRDISLDVKLHRVTRQTQMYNWHRWAPIILMSIAYIYGSLAKIYPDWLDATFIRRAFTNRYDNPTVNAFFSASWFHYFICYTGILFDGLIAFALLYKPTRFLALLASVVFHIFNSVVFQIGIFPYMSLGFILFFYPPEVIRQRLLSNREENTTPISPPKIPNLTLWALSLTLAFHLFVPLRHYVIDSNVFWTEEGHRMSWRMMLRSKTGSLSYNVIDKTTGERLPFLQGDFLTDKQARGLATHPDMIWQFAQYIHNHYSEKGIPVAVYATSYVSLNGRPVAPLTREDVDLAAVKWSHFTASDWLYPFQGWENY